VLKVPVLFQVSHSFGSKSGKVFRIVNRCVLTESMLFKISDYNCNKFLRTELFV
jgi:hypothetical protein